MDIPQEAKDAAGKIERRDAPCTDCRSTTCIGCGYWQDEIEIIAEAMHRYAERVTEVLRHAAREAEHAYPQAEAGLDTLMALGDAVDELEVTFLQRQKGDK